VRTCRAQRSSSGASSRKAKGLAFRIAWEKGEGGDGVAGQRAQVAAVQAPEQGLEARGVHELL
jgi:hypothetical protein